MKYSLDRSSRKYVCPRCGKRRFVLYVDESGKSLDSSCGRCDRADHCGHHYPPRLYFQDHAPVGRSDWRFTPPPPPRVPPTRSPSYLPTERFTESASRPYTDNPLYTALLRLMTPTVSRKRLDQAFRDYGVGTADGMTEFFQIDRQWKVRTGKKMGYDTAAHRNGKLNWVHREPAYADGYRLRQCFFGEHLLVDNDNTVWVFESEKTALIVSATLGWGFDGPPHTAIATGGCGGFNPKPELLADPWSPYAVLKGRKVVLFPDQGKFDEWQTRAQTLIHHCRELHIAVIGPPPSEPGSGPESGPESGRQLESDSGRQLDSDQSDSCPDGWDLADAILAEISTGRDPRQILCHRYELHSDTAAATQRPHKITG